MPAPSRVWSHVCSWASEGAKACARRRLGPSAALTVAWLQALSVTKVKGHRPARGTQREWLSPGEGAASLDKCPRGAAGPLQGRSLCGALITTHIHAWAATGHAPGTQSLSAAPGSAQAPPAEREGCATFSLQATGHAPLRAR